MESIKQKVPQIKICGITQDEEIQWLNEADVSYAGFVLYEKSCRYIPISKTQELFEKLNDNIKKVAVAVSPDVTMVKQVMDAGFDILQVHGNLTEEVLAVTEIPVWQAVNLTDANIFEELVREYRDLSIDEKITALLMDAKEFGSGKTFGWDAYERDEGKEMLRQLRERGDRYFFTGYRGCQFGCGKRTWTGNRKRQGKNTEICAEHAFYCLDGGKSEI